MENCMEMYICQVRHYLSPTTTVSKNSWPTVFRLIKYEWHKGVLLTLTNGKPRPGFSRDSGHLSASEVNGSYVPRDHRVTGQRDLKVCLQSQMNMYQIKTEQLNPPQGERAKCKPPMVIKYEWDLLVNVKVHEATNTPHCYPWQNSGLAQVMKGISIIKCFLKEPYSIAVLVQTIPILFPVYFEVSLLN